MPYSETWDEAAPNGATTQARDIDLLFRNLKIAIRERLVSLGATDFATADPIGFRVLELTDNGGFTAIMDRDNVNIQFFSGSGFINFQINANGDSFSRGSHTVGGALIGVLLQLSGLASLNGGLVVPPGQSSIFSGAAAFGAAVTVNGGHAHIVPQSSLTSAITHTIDLGASNNQHIVLNHTITLTMNNPQAGAFYLLKLTQDATGSRTITWPANVHWPNAGTAPAMSSTPGRSDLFTFYYDGTNFLGQVGAYGYNV
jgi:hypothetical protein